MTVSDAKSATPEPSRTEIVDGFAGPPETGYALIAAIYQSSGGFAQTLAEAFHTLQSFKDHLSELQRRPGAVFIIARQQGIDVGYLFVEPRPIAKLAHTSDLNMGVMANSRGLGVGGSLLDAAFARIDVQRFIEILYLMVRADNTAACRLYQSKGFETLATLERDSKVGSEYFDGILMRRSF